MSFNKPAPPQGYNDDAFLISSSGARIFIEPPQGEGVGGVPPPQDVTNWINGPDNIVNGADNLVFRKA